MSQKKHTIQLTEVEIDHLLTLLWKSAADGSYYGNPKDYWTRAERLTKSLQEAVGASSEAG